MWVMIFVGSLNFVLTIPMAMRYGFHFSDAGQFKILAEIFFFLWQFIFLIEAYIYWRIRKRIIQKNWARAHVILILLPVVVIRPLLLVRTLMHYNGVFNEWMTGLIFACLIVGHIFFIALLTNGIVKKQPDTAIEGRDVNLLDDVFDE